jgi:undecaprenyl-diphosphatase
VFGLLLGWIDNRALNLRQLERLTMRDAFLYGLAQSLALVPGVSRSGGTIGAGMLMGYRREAAARYSFLLAIPAVVGAGLFELKDVATGEAAVEWGPTLLATVIAFGTGLLVIVYFLRYISTHSFRPFVTYRVLLGLLILGLLAGGVIDA